MIGVQLRDLPLSCAALPPNPGLLVCKQVRTDLVGVMRLQQLALLIAEAGQLGLCFRQLLLGRLGDQAHVSLNRLANAGAVRVGKLDNHIVALNGGFHSFNPVIPLSARATQPTPTDQIAIAAAIALGLGKSQTTAAPVAEHAAPQVMEVPPRPLAALALAVEQVLHFLKRAPIDQRLMPTGIDFAAVADLTNVVGIAQNLRQPLEVDGTLREPLRSPVAQPPLFKDHRQLHQRVVAAGVEHEGVLDQGSALLIEHYVPDRPAFDVNGFIEIADRHVAWRSADFGLVLLRPFDFNRQLPALMRRDGPHDAENQHAGRAVVDRLAGRGDRNAVFLQQAEGRPLVDLIACPTRDFPKDHDIYITAFLDVGEHPFEGFALEHGASGHAGLDVLPDNLSPQTLSLSFTTLALRRQAQALRITLFVDLLR